MPEFVWDGKYGPDGKKSKPVRVALPFQDVETVNESAQERDIMLDLFARNEPREWRYLKVPQKEFGKLQPSEFSDLEVLGS